ncbi:MAG: DUF547 domain-containing protein [Nitrospinae bacterium]|nr:DUF547 domain-containing protein [Nitrospinota bacterium]
MSVNVFPLPDPNPGQSQTRRFVLSPIIVTILLSLFTPAPLHAFDFGQWDAILKKNTRKSNWKGVSYTGFDYAGVAGSKEFDKLIAGLETFSPETLRGRDEIISFWINVYNIFAVKLARDHFPVKGIKDIGSVIYPVWKHPAGKVGSKSYSLDDIEHNILRPMNEPAIHFAIVCASVSCPDLRTESYTAPALREQLKTQTRLFLENSGKGMRVEHENKTVHLSMIFDWYKKDFDAAGGVIGFLNSEMGGRRKIPADYSIKSLPYNWDLNITR